MHKGCVCSAAGCSCLQATTAREFDNWEDRLCHVCPAKSQNIRCGWAQQARNVHELFDVDFMHTCRSLEGVGLLSLQEALALGEGLSGPAHPLCRGSRCSKESWGSQKLTDGEGNGLPVGVGCPRLPQLLNLLHVATIEDEQGLHRCGQWPPRHPSPAGVQHGGLQG